MGGIQFLLPLFEIVGTCPADHDVNVQMNKTVLDDLIGAIKEFREALGASVSKESLVSRPMTTSETETSQVLNQLTPIQDTGAILDETSQQIVLNASIEIFQLASALLTATTPFESFKLPGNMRNTKFPVF